MKYKFIIFLFSFIFIIIIGGISYQIIIKDSTQNLINECSKSHDEKSLIECGTSTMLNYQEKYDIFYHNHLHSHAINIIFIGLFNECKTHANECSTHNDSLFFSFINECANTDDDNCINTALDTKNPDSLTIFKKQIIKNINVAIPKPCSGELYNYFNSLTNEQKSKLDSKIIKACSY